MSIAKSKETLGEDHVALDTVNIDENGGEVKRNDLQTTLGSSSATKRIAWCQSPSEDMPRVYQYWMKLRPSPRRPHSKQVVPVCLLSLSQKSHAAVRCRSDGQARVLPYTLSSNGWPLYWMFDFVSVSTVGVGPRPWRLISYPTHRNC